MTALYAGALCTLILLSTCVCLYNGLSAAAYRLFKTQILHAVLLLANFIPLSMLICRLSVSEILSPLPWTVATIFLMIANLCALLIQMRWVRRHTSQASIKDSYDHFPCALCFALENGQPCLRNLKMEELSHQIMGEVLSNANTFWNALADQPVVALENGQTWSFERTAMDVDGQTVYQIIGTDVTQKARLNRKLEADNRQLDDMNRRLREYSQNVQALTREREILRAKVRIHDDLGHTLLRTRQFLAGGQSDPEEICASWRQNIHLLLGGNLDEAPADSFDQLLSAAQAIGVTIDRRGEFPIEGTETVRLTEAAIHECLTNLVRHAGGTRLEVIGVKKTGCWHICCRNDGKIPTGPIVEGGGLSSLRVRVEAAGGTMQVDHAPRFALTLILPEETERCFP